MPPLRVRDAILRSTMGEKNNVFSAVAAPLLQWYDENKRDLPWRRNTDPYRVWVSEIMLQQTRVAAVIPYYERWMCALPDVQTLAAADEAQLMKLWQGLGYYSRARNLQKAAKQIVEEYGGQFPDRYEKLLKLPGVGEYTAGAVASIAFSEKVGAVDGNVLRIAARLGAMETDILDPRMKKMVRGMLDAVIPEDRSGDFNQALMDLGATVCLPGGRPVCECCPLAGQCEARRLGRQQELPLRGKKKARRIEEMTVYLLLRGGEVALRKRSEDGLLAGLWEFPYVSGRLSEAEAVQPLSGWGVTARDWKKAIPAKHVFTHVEWHMNGYMLDIAGEGAEDFLWVDRNTLETLAIPTAFKTYYTECMSALGK